MNVANVVNGAFSHHIPTFIKFITLLVKPFACITEGSVLLKVHEFGVKDLDQVFFTEIQIVMWSMIKNMLAEIFFIDLNGEFADSIIGGMLATQVIIFILQFQDKHYIFPCVFEPDMVGDIPEYHFNGIIETVIECRIVFVMKGLFMHTIHFDWMKKNLGQLPSAIRMKQRFLQHWIMKGESF
jgi:hypothetical protein